MSSRFLYNNSNKEYLEYHSFFTSTNTSNDTEYLEYHSSNVKWYSIGQYVELPIEWSRFNYVSEDWLSHSLHRTVDP